MDKKKKIIYFCGAIIFSIILCVQAAYATDRPVAEKADAIYRAGSLLGSAGFGHAGLYYQYPGYNLDPKDPYSHLTIESLKNSGVTCGNFGKFIHATFFWSVRTSIYFNYLKRQDIILTAKRQLGAAYGVIRYKNPGGTPGNAEPSFRCDGLVEYCFEQAGIDIVSGDTQWWHIYPSMQKDHLHLRSSAEEKILIPQEISFIRPAEDGEIINGIYTLSAFASDLTSELDGSGITKVEFWAGEPDDTPNVYPGLLLGSDEQDTLLTGHYQYPCDTTKYPNGEYTLYAKAFDQAGNTKLSEGVTVILENMMLFTGIWIGKYSSWFDVPRWHPPGDYKVTIDCKFYTVNTAGEYEEKPADSFIFKTPSGNVYTCNSNKLDLGFTKEQFESIFTDGTYETTGTLTIGGETHEITETMEKDSSVKFLDIPRLTSVSPPSGSTVPAGSVDITLNWKNVPGAEDYYVDLGNEGLPFVVYDYPGTSYTFEGVPIPECSTSSWSIYISCETKYRFPKDDEKCKFRLTLNSVYWDDSDYHLYTPCPEE